MAKTITISSEKSKRVYASQVLDRALRIIDCFTRETPELKFIQIAERSGLNRSTAYRIIEAMRAHHLLDADSKTGNYHLGMKWFERGAVAVGRLELSSCGGMALEELSRRTGETAHLCIL